MNRRNKPLSPFFPSLAVSSLRSAGGTTRYGAVSCRVPLLLLLLPLLFCACQGKSVVSRGSATETVPPQASPPEEAEAQPASEPAELELFRRAYPDVVFSAEYDGELDDYLVHIQVDGRSGELYWCGGRFLPAEELVNKDKFWTLLYGYAKEIPDPADFSDAMVENIRRFGSAENRSSGGGSPPFFFDLIYDCRTQVSVEKHIVRHSFLGKSTNVHERIVKPLERVEKRILELARTDREVSDFVTRLLSADCYSWRSIRDNSNRSFHSVGIAVDILPEGWGSKNVYWAWRRDIDKDWMLLPLNRRWMPPAPVIRIFEEEGFIYGGKWIIWDNMHFEYHPEIIMYNMRL